MEAISKSLGCLKYHGNMEADERAAVQSKWMAGATPADRCIAATSAFVHGIDAPYVDLIIFLETPFGLVDFIQAAARGGRRGRACMVVLAHKGDAVRVSNPDHSLAAVMNKYMANTTVCRRLLLTEAMDGEAKKCMTENYDQLCDICLPKTPMIDLINQCARSGPLPGPACLQHLPVTQPAVVKIDEDAYMFDDMDDEVFAQVEMPVASGSSVSSGQLVSSLFQCAGSLIDV